MVSGVSVQVSGRYRGKQMTACDELPSTNSGLEPVESSRVEDKGQTVSAFCHLLSDT
jgi:hypothetical protein